MLVGGPGRGVDDQNVAVHPRNVRQELKKSFFRALRSLVLCSNLSSNHIAINSNTLQSNHEGTEKNMFLKKALNFLVDSLESQITKFRL